MTSNFINTTAKIASMLTSLRTLKTSPPSLYVDLEGNKVSRNGTISIVQIFAKGLGEVYLVDIHTLGVNAFTTPADTEPPMTLKTLLEDANIPKVFFDVRNDSDALFHHYQVALAGIEDIQLMEYAARRRMMSYTAPQTRAPKGRVSGLGRCIEHDVPLSEAERARLSAIKAKGTELFDPNKGGSYEVFDARPLAVDIVDYCVQDVKLLPALRGVYWSKLNEKLKGRVEEGAKARVRESQSSEYQPHGTHKPLAPW